MIASGFVHWIQAPKKSSLHHTDHTVPGSSTTGTHGRHHWSRDDSVRWHREWGAGQRGEKVKKPTLSCTWQKHRASGSLLSHCLPGNGTTPVFVYTATVADFAWMIDDDAGLETKLDSTIFVRHNCIAERKS